MDDSLINVADMIVSILMSLVPVDTGNLKTTIGYDITNENEIIINVGGIEAPYAVVVNEGRTDRPMSAKEYHNMGWIDRSLQQATEILSQYQGGVAISYV